MNNTILLINKPETKTPLQALETLRKKFPVYAGLTIGYAGRLDPLASGLLLLLIGEENKKRKLYERLPKTYTFNVITGIQTDTHDLMGLTTQIHAGSSADARLNTLLKEYIGTQTQQYPLYSSARVSGKPLYYWARAGKVPLQIPTKTIEIYDLQCTARSEITLKELSAYAVNVVSRVQGVFRQKEIIANWQLLARTHPEQIFPIYSCELRCSSGTYVRKLVDDIGKRLEGGAVAHQITRTQIGEYTLDQAIALEQ